MEKVSSKLIIKNMGQYYYGVILTKDKSDIIAWDRSRGGGSKLTEHSWMENEFVKSFENLIYNNPMPVVWAGDYADPENGLDEGPNLYDLCTNKTEVKPEKELDTAYSRYVINHDTKQYVDKHKMLKDDEGWQMHPLPLLTAEGNGRGGGDYRGDSELIGTWARCFISVSEKKPEGYEELICDFVDR